MINFRAVTLPLAIGCLLIIASCTNNTAGQNNSSEESAALPAAAAPAQEAVSRPATSVKEMPAIDCSSLLTTTMIEESCKLSGIAERVTSVEQNNRNCNRVYTVGKGFGAGLIFILTPKNDAAGAADTFDWMKNEYSSKGLQPVSGVGDGAFTLQFQDKLTKRQQYQLVFKKNNMVAELKAEESAGKNPCPCYNLSQLKSLAQSIAEKL